MQLSVGDKLGPYEILTPIDAGGMGEVYRAHDKSLARDVAIKVLPAALAQDPDRLARFEREAKVLAALNHPNIAIIHGLENRAIVMELVEGPTLADRLERGALSLNESLAIGRQIADALEAAHERGVVHRDLKPANIKVREDGTVKVLDFGLATAVQAAQEDGVREPGAGANSPTLTLGATEAGMILGTAAYMSPEQAVGKAVDRRADIWSFGIVLFEMLTGKRMFTGETVAHVLADVINREIDLKRLPKATPAPIRNLIQRCLNRDVKSRLQWIGEARIAIAEYVANPHSGTEVPRQAEARPTLKSRVPWVVAAAAIAAAMGLGYVAYRHVAEDPQRVVKLSVLPPEKGEFFAGNGPPAVSPDGRRIAFVAIVEGKRGLWVRDLDSPTPRLLAGTEGANNPIWSPDSRFVGFAAGGKLKKIDVTGGPALTICDAVGIRGASWSKDDVIVFTPNVTGGLFRVPAAGGVPTPLTELDKSRNEDSHRSPWFLPDGRHFLYLIRSTDAETSGVFVGDLESKTRKPVVTGDSAALYAPVSDKQGYLMFLRDRTLMAQPFDAGRIAVTGEAVPIAERVDRANNYGMFAISQNGVLAYTSGGTGGNTQIAWFDRSGKELGTVGTPGNLLWASLSPDGTTVATDRLDSQSGNRDLWLHDLSRGGTPSRLTFAGNSQYPIWSPDGKRIVFLGTRSGKDGLYLKAANGTGQEEEMESAPDRRPADWSRDGRYVIAETPNAGGDIWIHPQSGDKKPYAYLHSEFIERNAKLSPDGRWLAYRSNESKRTEIYVVSFPMPEGKWQISTNGGTIPVWSRDGGELFFVSLDNKMMAVEIKTLGGNFQASVPKPLFDVRLSTTNPNFDVSKDSRFLIPTAVEQSANVPMTVVLNWQSALKK